MELEAPEFVRLCGNVTEDELRRLVRRIDTHVSTVAEAAILDDEIDASIAETLAQRLHALVDHIADADRDARSLVVGAIRYFVLTTDDANDLVGPHGLDDDVHVLNAVCERIGRSDLRIPV